MVCLPPLPQLTFSKINILPSLTYTGHMKLPGLTKFVLFFGKNTRTLAGIYNLIYFNDILVF